MLLNYKHYSPALTHESDLVWAQLAHNYLRGITKSQNVSHPNQNLWWITGQSKHTVFLSGFGAFLESETKWSKRLVQPPHHLVARAHHKKVLVLLNKLRLQVHSCNWLCTSGFLHYQLLSSCCSLCYSLTLKTSRLLVHRISHYGKCKMVDSCHKLSSQDSTHFN